MNNAESSQGRPRSRTQPSMVVEAEGDEPFDTRSMLPEKGPEQGPEDPFADGGPAAGGPEPAPRPATDEPEPTGYAAIDIMASDPDLLAAVIKENLGGNGLNINDLQKVVVPAGGARYWQIESDDGNQPVTAIEGIIIHKGSPRAFWQKSIEETGGNTQPDCSSTDGIHGIPGPEGAVKIKTADNGTMSECATCPLNQFGSARNGRGKACQEKELLYVLLPDRVLPIVLQIPPTSLRSLHDYMVKLVDSKDFRSYWQVATKFELETVKADPVNYSRVAPTRAANVAKSHIPQLKQFREQLIPALARFNDRFHQELLREPEALPEPAENPPPDADQPGGAQESGEPGGPQE